MVEILRSFSKCMKRYITKEEYSDLTNILKSLTLREDQTKFHLL